MAFSAELKRFSQTIRRWKAGLLSQAALQRHPLLRVSRLTGGRTSERGSGIGPAFRASQGGGQSRDILG
jgi:hypothetical protein